MYKDFFFSLSCSKGLLMSAQVKSQQLLSSSAMKLSKLGKTFKSKTNSGISSES